MDGRILALLSALCFGINPIVLKAGLQKSNPTTAVFVGLVSGLPLLMILSPALGGFQLDQLTALSAIYFLLGGLFGVVFGRAALYLSIDQLGSTRATIFKNGAPVVTALIAPLFLSESVELARWAGILLVTLGLTLIGGRIKSLASANIGRNALAVASLPPIFYGIRPIFSKLGLNLTPLPLAATLLSYAAAIAVYLLYFGWQGTFSIGSTGSRNLMFFAIAGVLQVMGLLLLNFALDNSEVSKIYPISASAPFVTFLLSVTVLRNIERLTIWDLVGTTAVVGGVIWLLI